MKTITSSPELKEQVAIVVVGYNRRLSMNRLLSSLLVAHYPSKSIPLVISIDCSMNEDIYDDARSFNWPYGEKYVIIQEQRLGLKNHILSCGDLTHYFKAIILLEDDVFVGNSFYKYAEKVIDYYYNDLRIGGFSLYQNEVMGQFPAVYLNDGSSVYLKQTPASWGECWTDVQWKLFRDWLESFSESSFSIIDMPNYMKAWKKAWSKYYMAYLIDTDRFFVFPHVSLTTCFGDAGEHSSSMSSIGQVNFLNGESSFTFRPFEQLVKYDIYGVNQDIFNWIGFEKGELCVDWYGANPNYNKSRYVLTPIKLDCPIIKTYGLMMRPIELNIKYKIAGDGLYLYDTQGKSVTTEGKELPVSMAHYYLRFFKRNLVLKYIYDIIKNSLYKKITRK